MTPGDLSLDDAIAELRSDPELARLLDRKDHDRLFALLRRRAPHASGRMRVAMERALAEPRAFLLPDRQVSLFTLNGIGTRFYSDEDRRPDGSFLVTRWLTILYLPIWPLGRYLVKQERTGKYLVFGRVPLSPRAWRTPLVAALIVGAVAAMFGGAALFARQHPQVYFVDGLDVPLRLDVDGRKLALGPGEHSSIELRPGRHHVKVATRNGRPLDEDDIEVTAGKTVAYNPLGAGGLYTVDVIYTSESAVLPPPKPAPPTYYFGQKLLSLDGIDLTFERPDTHQMVMGQQYSRQKLLAVEPGASRFAVSYLLGHDDPARAAAVATHLAWAQPSERSLRDAEIALAALPQPPSLVEFARDVLAHVPDSVEAHRYYQEQRTRAGEEDALVAEYRARAARSPDSPTASYLLARLLPASEALALLGPLVERHPTDPWLRRGIADSLSVARRYREAIAVYDQAAALDEAMAATYAMRFARIIALLGAGRLDDALRLATPAAKPETLDPLASAIYAMVVHRVGHDGGTPPERSFPGVDPSGKGDPVRLATARALLGCLTGGGATAEDLAALPAERRAELTLCSTVPDDPRAAMALARATPGDAIRLMNDEAAVLLAGELHRTGDDATARRVLAGQRSLRPQLRERVLGGSAPPSAHDDLAVRAAIAFLDARATRDAAARARLVDEARRDDVFAGAVTRAIASWPAP